MWTFTAICPENKLIFAHLAGKRTKENAQRLVAMVRNRTRSRIKYITTDGSEIYPEVIRHIFGKFILGSSRRKLPRGFCYAQVIKHIEKGRCVEVKRKIVFGNKQTLDRKLERSRISTTINTSFIERSNLTMRQHNKRVERRSQGYSKMKEFLVRQNSLSIAYYNFCLPHFSLYYLKEDRKMYNTPAMEAGLTDHAWSMMELISYTIN
jgi:IS1 family transposase